MVTQSTRLSGGRSPTLLSWLTRSMHCWALITRRRTRGLRFQTAARNSTTRRTEKMIRSVYCNSHAVACSIMLGRTCVDLLQKLVDRSKTSAETSSGRISDCPCTSSLCAQQATTGPSWSCGCSQPDEWKAFAASGFHPSRSTLDARIRHHREEPQGHVNELSNTGHPEGGCFIPAAQCLDPPERKMPVRQKNQRVDKAFSLTTL